MYDLISIGNISVDLFFKDKSLTFKDGRFQLAVGGKYFTNYFHTGVGGGGANVAIGVQTHGLKAAVLGKIGNNSFKEVILSELKKHDVTTYLCQLEDKYINISSVLLTPSGERSIINYETPHQHIIGSDRELLKLERTKGVYMGNLPDVPLLERARLLYFFKQRAIPIFVNLGVRDCRRPITQISNIINKLTVLIINGHEFADLVKKKYQSINFKNDVTDYLPILKERVLIITEDKRGSYGYYQGKVIHVKAPDIKKIVDSTGAGDGFTSGFIAEYLASKNVEAAMERGTAYAKKILLKIGAN
jgi:sugar/nucleoside kinase (ribokinase family)